jgi:hypothetical protein
MEHTHNLLHIPDSSANLDSSLDSQLTQSIVQQMTQLPLMSHLPQNQNFSHNQLQLQFQALQQLSGSNISQNLGGVSSDLCPEDHDHLSGLHGLVCYIYHSSHLNLTFLKLIN